MTTPDDDNLVAAEDRCPLCGERRADSLLWLDDERVECQTCGFRYTPGRRCDQDE